MEPLRIAARVLFAFVVLHALLRVSGKRVVSQGTTFDFTLALILGDMLDDAIWAEVPFAAFLTGIGTLVLFHIALAYGAFHIRLLERIVEGEPVTILREGRLVPRGLRRERLSEKEAEELLRTGGFERDRWSEIRHAWIDHGGKLGVTRYAWAREATGSDLPRVKEMRKG